MNYNKLKKLNRLIKEAQTIIDETFKLEREKTDKECEEYVKKMEQRERKELNKNKRGKNELPSNTV